MTKPKSPDDLISTIKAGMTDTAPNLPTSGDPPGRDHDLLLSLAEAIRSSDQTAIDDIRSQLDLPREAVDLLAVVVREHDIAAAIVATGGDVTESVVRLRSEVVQLRRMQPKSIQESRNLATALTEIDRDLRRAEVAEREHNAAQAIVSSCRSFCPGLFGLPAGRPGSFQNGSAVLHNACVAAGCDPYRTDSWRDLRRPAPRPSRRPKLVATK